MQCPLKSLPRRTTMRRDRWIRRDDETYLCTAVCMCVCVRVYVCTCACARARTRAHVVCVCVRVETTTRTATVWRRPLDQAQTGGDYSWISMAIWIIYWTVSLDTTSQNHVIYWHPHPSSRPLVLLAVTYPPAPLVPTLDARFIHFRR